jgi:hypothetical protein
LTRITLGGNVLPVAERTTSKHRQEKKVISDSDYIRHREWFRLLGVRAEEEGKTEKAEHFAGVVRGLDLAFGDGVYKEN